NSVQEPPGPLKKERLLVCTFADHLTTIVPVAVAAALSTYLLTRYFSSQSSPKSRVNMSINKDSPKVVHSFDMEDIGDKAVYCRCWRSKKVSETSSMDHVIEFILIGWCGDSLCLLNDPASLIVAHLYEPLLSI
ncbi:CDGSH iron-sulfur domain-containing protein 1-like, partial [Sinocyclocheilus anshuiensis]|uniref:CDGSH iron-sulfur domain-containing protein 1-like n=1 Tax=Sinocyclocheilus anshuiensis TaxID=1608454 RepID=UPI0007BA38E1